MVLAYCDGKSDERLSAELQAVIDRRTASGVTVELRDEAGRTLLTAMPVESDLGPDLTEEEIERIVAEPGAMPLADFWKRLGVRRTCRSSGATGRSPGWPNSGPPQPTRRPLPPRPSGLTE